MGHKGLASRLTDPAQAGGALLDIGVYPVAYLCRLFGKPLAVRCEGEVHGGIDWREDIVLSFPGGQQGQVHVSILDEGESALIRLEGTGARLELPRFYGTDRAVLVRADGTRLTAEGDGSYVFQFDAVAGEIRAGLTQSRFVPRQDTLDVMEVLDECRRQMGLRYPFEK